jgi:DNA-binding NtrC family response regulator
MKVEDQTIGQVVAETPIHRKLVALDGAKYPVNIRAATAAFEARLIQRVLKLCRGNVTRAAELLQISRRTLQAKIRVYDIDAKKIRKNNMYPMLKSAVSAAGAPDVIPQFAESEEAKNGGSRT